MSRERSAMSSLGSDAVLFLGAVLAVLRGGPVNASLSRKLSPRSLVDALSSNTTRGAWAARSRSPLHCCHATSAPAPAINATDAATKYLAQPAVFRSAGFCAGIVTTDSAGIE